MWQLYKSRKKQILWHEIEPNPSKDRAMHKGDNPSFWDEFIKFTFFSTIFFMFRIFNQVPKYLATGLYRPSGTYSPPAEASTQELKCKTNTIPILMHHMIISITFKSLFSGTKAKKVGNPKKKMLFTRKICSCLQT
jgi:hypothetical protein